MNNSPIPIIIVNYNGKNLLGQCFKSLLKTSRTLLLECWVVDNGSTDETIAWLQENYPQIHYIENEENLGFAKANNQALTVCSGEYVLLLNNDTIVRENALQRLVQALDINPRLAAVGPKLFNKDGSIQPSCMHFPVLWRAPVNYFKMLVGGSAKYAIESSDEVTTVDAVTGACMLIRREALDNVGLFDENFFMYAEETDWCYRAHSLGWQIGYVPSAEVVHLGGQSARREPKRFYVERRLGRVRFHQKHYGNLSAHVAAWLIRLNIILRSLIFPDQRKDYLDILHAFNAATSRLFAR